MADVQVEHGYVRTANALYDALLRVRVPEGHRTVMFALIRLTYGYQRTHDRLSVRYIAETIVRDPRDVRRILDDLVRWEMITREGGRSGRGHIATVGIVSDFERWAVTRSVAADRRARCSKRGEGAPVFEAEKRGAAAPVSDAEKGGDHARKGGRPPSLQRQLPKTAIKNRGPAAPPPRVSAGAMEPEPELEAARLLATAVRRRLGESAVPTDFGPWARELARIGDADRVLSVARLYGEKRFDGAPYTPQVATGRAFREKWSQLLAWSKRQPRSAALRPVREVLAPPEIETPEPSAGELEAARARGFPYAHDEHPDAIAIREQRLARQAEREARARAPMAWVRRRASPQSDAVGAEERR